MTRKETIKLISEAIGESQKRTADILDQMQTAVFATMKNGEEVKLFDGVTLAGKEVPERVARNPQTGESVVVAKHIAPKAKFGTPVKNFLKEA